LTEKRQSTILLLGVFTDPKDPKKNIRTATCRIAEMFSKNHLSVITSSIHSGRIARLWDNLWVILTHQKEIKIVIIPLYGTRPAFIWQEIVSRVVKFFHKKLILTIDGGSIPDKMEKNPRHFLKAMKRADTLICPSAFFYHYLDKYPVKKIQIENAINLTGYLFMHKKTFRPKILWMRAFEKTYNPLMAVKVAKILYSQFPDFEMVMAGPDHGMLAETKKRVHEEGLSQNVFFPGYINLEEKLHYAAQYDFYICTNEIDNAPVSVIEFMALGLVIIATNVGGLPDLIADEQNGFLIPPNNAEEMASKIVTVIQNPLKGIAMTEKAYAFTKNFGEDVVMEKWKKLFEKL